MVSSVFREEREREVAWLLKEAPVGGLYNKALECLDETLIFCTNGSSAFERELWPARGAQWRLHV